MTWDEIDRALGLKLPEVKPDPGKIQTKQRSTKGRKVRHAARRPKNLRF